MVTAPAIAREIAVPLNRFTFFMLHGGAFWIVAVGALWLPIDSGYRSMSALRANIKAFHFFFSTQTKASPLWSGIPPP